MAAATEPRPAIELAPRTALLVWGGAPLVVGLALVGAGADEGAALALAGLFNTIYGIHTFGRLGPDDAPDEDGAASDREEAATNGVWTGALTFLAGLVVALDGHLVRRLGPVSGGWAAATYGVMAVGLLRVRQGVMAQRAGRVSARLRERTAKVEKRRRLDKSPAP
jgi:hypothetical protein